MNRINTVRKEGGSRVIAVSKILPLDWTMVDITITKSTREAVYVKIEKVK